MNDKLKAIYDQLEVERKRLFTKLSTIPADKLDPKPSKAKWSVNEILTHLVTSEQLTLKYLKKKSLGVDQLKNSGISERIRWLVLKVSQRLPFKYRAPEVVMANTPPPLSFPQLVAAWNASRQELKEFLDQIADRNINKLIYKHPVAGRFDVVQCLMFMREHYRHHLPQIKHLL